MAYLLVTWSDGRQGAVLETAWNDAGNVELFQRARAGPYEDGSVFGGPFTVEDLGEPVSSGPLAPSYLVVAWPDGREAGVLEAVYIDPDNAVTYADTVAVAFEDGTAWSEP